MSLIPITTSTHKEFEKKTLVHMLQCYGDWAYGLTLRAFYILTKDTLSFLLSFTLFYNNQIKYNSKVICGTLNYDIYV